MAFPQWTGVWKQFPRLQRNEELQTLELKMSLNLTHSHLVKPRGEATIMAGIKITI